MALIPGSQEVLKTPGLVAAEDLSAKQYHVVQLASTAMQVKISAAGTSKNLGILQNDPVAGEPASVVTTGFTKAVAEASVAAGVLLTANSTGQVQATTTANDQIIGRSLTASVSAGDIIVMNAYQGNL